MDISNKQCSKCKTHYNSFIPLLPCEFKLFQNIFKLVELNRTLRHLSLDKIRNKINCNHSICYDCLNYVNFDSEDLFTECLNNKLDTIYIDKVLTENEIDLITKVVNFKFNCYKCFKRKEEDMKNYIIQNIIFNYKNMTKNQIVEDVKKLL